jgi:predicted  nucleic acid-binding Zn-ribbon protein
VPSDIRFCTQIGIIAALYYHASGPFIPEVFPAGLHSTAEAARAALHKASEAGAQARHAAGDSLEAVTSAPEQLKQGSVDRAQSVMDTVEAAVGAVREDVRQGVQKAKRVGQGLREKLESVTAHIRE